MQRFKNILFVNESGSSKADTPRAAVELARRNGARLTLCDVAYELARSFTQLKQSLERLRRQRIEALLADIDTDGVDIDFVLLDGAPFLEIVHQVKRGQHDLVIKNSEPGGLSDTSFGANDMHLMRQCPCPLWIARSDGFGSHRAIVAALDVDPNVPANDELNELVLDLATSLARQSGCGVHVVHGVWMPGERTMRGLNPETDEPLAQQHQDRRALLTDLLAQRNLDCLDLQVHLEHARPADYVLDVASRVGADLVVLGTVARTGVPGFLIGNTAERILSRLRCSALAVKPAGFLTPVT
ncbi:MAG: universal stress protein [Xanthomonadales bacterium]|nr:universal stress protein [Xanthomonadales bacterium]